MAVARRASQIIAAIVATLTVGTGIYFVTDNTAPIGTSSSRASEAHIMDAYVYDTLTTGAMTFSEATEATFLTARNLPCGALSAGEQCSYIDAIDNEYMLKLYAEGDGSSGIQNQSINMYPQTQKFGQADVATVWYVGAGDGCMALGFSTSSTFPTASATSTSFCN